MIQRVWRCTVEPDRAHEYEAFAHNISMPMFRAQAGFRGCLMARNGPECEVLTLWANEAAIEAVEQSESYRETVAKIRNAGFIREELGTSTLSVHELEII